MCPHSCGERRAELWIGTAWNSQCAWLFSRAFGGAEKVVGVLLRDSGRLESVRNNRWRGFFGGWNESVVHGLSVFN